MVQGHPPKPRREFSVRGKRVPSGEHLCKYFLGQVLGAVRIAAEPGAEAVYRVLPTPDQVRERRGVVLRLHPPHQLLVARGEERLERLPGRAHASGPRRGVPVVGHGWFHFIVHWLIPASRRFV